MLKILHSMPVEIAQSFRRFPVAAGLMAIFTVVWVVLPDHDVVNQFNLYLGLALSAYFSVCLVLINEATNTKPRLIVQVPAVILITALVWFSSELNLQPWMALGSVLLFLSNAAFWRQAPDNARVWHFTHVLWTAALFATVGSIIYFLGLTAITYALSTLFNIEITDLTNNLIIPIGLCFLAPMVWLSNVPVESTSVLPGSTASNFVGRAIGFIGTWLMAPLMLVYTLILLAYVVKLVLDLELPDNEVGRLVFPFILLGTLTWLVLAAPGISDGKITSLYRRCWFIVVLPVAWLLAVVVFIRIAEYGLTPSRILLGSCALWAICLGGYYAVVRLDGFDIRLIPGLASVLLLIAALAAGPVSYFNQMSRAKHFLVKTGLQSDNGDQLWQAADFDKSVIQNHDAAGKARGALSYVLHINGEKAREALFPSVTFELPSNNPFTLEGATVDTPDQANDDNTEDHGLLFEDDAMQAATMEWAVLEALGLDDVPISGPENVKSLNYSFTDQTVDIAGFESIQSLDFFPGTAQRFGSTYSLKQSGVFVTLLENNREIAQLNVDDWAQSQPNDNGLIVPESPIVDLIDEPERRISLLIRELHINEHGSDVDVYVQVDLLSKGI